jgi:hypothetical protein
VVTYANGRLPATVLRDISTPHQLRADAAASFERLRARGKTDGLNLGTSQPDHSYRPYADQVTILEQNYDHTPRAGLTVANGGIKYYAGKTWYRKPGCATAATPGTSNHGLGVAVDFQGLGGFTGTGFAWMTKHAPDYGWTNTQGRSIGEAWHWVYDPTLDKHLHDKTPDAPEEDDVKRYRKYASTGKDQAIKKGTWTSIRFTDEGYISLLAEKAQFDALVELTFAGLPDGRPVQVRFVTVQVDKDGKNGVVKGYYPIDELIGTSGSTFPKTTEKGSLGANLRLRAQIQVFDDGVTITAARAVTDYWK